MEQIRVLVVTTTRLGREGITNVIMNYYRNINTRKVQFDFAIGNTSTMQVTNEIKKLGGKIYYMPSRKNNLIHYMKALKKTIEDNHYKIVHIHGNSGTMLFDILTAKRAGAEYILPHCHNSKTDHKVIHYVFKPFLNMFMTEGIACSKVAGDWLYSKPYKIVSNGIDLDKYKFNSVVREKVRKDLGIENKFVVGHVGQFKYQKNHEFLIKIFAKVHEKIPSSVLLLVGDGPLREDIIKDIEKYKLKDSVIMLGERDDVNKIYQAMDVFVFPSRFEGLPLVLVEAETSGLPCIASSAVTREANVTGNITYIDLEEDKDKWVSSICKYRIEHRKAVNEKLLDSKFNIKKEAKNLEDYYISLINVKCKI